MKNAQKGFVVPLLIALIAVLVAGAAAYVYEKNQAQSQNPAAAAPVSQAEQIRIIQKERDAHADFSGSSAGANTAPANGSNPNMAGSNWMTYDNLGIAFQYPAEMGIPKESLYGNGLGSVSFDYNSSGGQPLAVFIGQDTDPQGRGLLNETFDQMISRFRANDSFIYDVKDVTADGVQGKELFYKSAVSGQPYHVDAYFPFRSGSYVSVGADYQSVPLSMFDSILSTLRWDNATVFRIDRATGMAIYSNNGIKFEYPVKFDTDYASLNVQTSVEEIDGSKLDSNGCYPAMSGAGRPGPASPLVFNGVKFCYTASSDVGAGQLYTDYTYTTFRSGKAYTVDYAVHTSNGCGSYQSSPDLSAPENQKYNECLDFGKNYNSIVVTPIRDSISTFAFTD